MLTKMLFCLIIELLHIQMFLMYLGGHTYKEKNIQKKRLKSQVISFNNKQRQCLHCTTKHNWHVC